MKFGLIMELGQRFESNTSLGLAIIKKGINLGGYKLKSWFEVLYH